MLLLGLLWAGAGRGEMCALDNVPAATILVPHFEADLSDPEGPQTSVEIFNSGSTSRIAHVTLWTDLGVPTLGFGLEVPGFGRRALDLQALFEGTMPAGLCDPSRTLDLAEAQRLVDAHTGRPVDDGGITCLGSSQGDGVARGYLTIDVARLCSESNPSEAGYFDGEARVAGYANRLFAKVYQDEAGVHASAAPAVHLEAEASFDASSTPRGTTFYSRYAAGGVDGREPLPSLWSVPLLLHGTNSEWTVWRGGESFGSTATGFACSESPVTQPVTRVHCFDHFENLVELCSDGDCLGAESQRISPVSEGIDSPYISGWCVLDLATSADESDSSQAWVGSGVSDLGLGSLSVAPGPRGMHLPPPCEARDPRNEPHLPLFTDDFESGDFAAWSTSVGGGS